MADVRTFGGGCNVQLVVVVIDFSYALMNALMDALNHSIAELFEICVPSYEWPMFNNNSTFTYFRWPMHCAHDEDIVNTFKVSGTKKNQPENS